MDFRPTGGLFLRLDPNGNLAVYTPSGITVLTVQGNLLSARVNKVFDNPLTNYTFTSASNIVVSVGTGPIAPQIDFPNSIHGIFTVTAHLGFASTVAGDTVTAQLIRGTTSPVLGNAVPGDGVSAENFPTFTLTNANTYYDQEVSFEVSPLTVGTSYYFYFAALRASGSGTITRKAGSMISIEAI